MANCSYVASAGVEWGGYRQRVARDVLPPASVVLYLSESVTSSPLTRDFASIIVVHVNTIRVSASMVAAS